MNILYPASPDQPDESKLAPSPAFRKQVGKVIGSIFLFLLVYLLLVLAAAALAVGCCWLGIVIITTIHNFYALIFGFGLVCVGFSVIYFLIKFIFSKSKDENASRVEITEADQPRLFEFIRRLTKETHTPFPKKIFISPDVNASVFYNSSFWSMFLPVKKNLLIGLGLVNSINASELKAVIAHEFGHFSQRSMKLGSFTYNVNRVIYNMLYDNEGYSDFLASWAGCTASWRSSPTSRRASPTASAISYGACMVSSTKTIWASAARWNSTPMPSLPAWRRRGSAGHPARLGDGSSAAAQTGPAGNVVFHYSVDIQIQNQFQKPVGDSSHPRRTDIASGTVEHELCSG